MRSTERNDTGVLVRSLAVLESFTADTPALTLAEITRGSGLPKATVHRLLTQLIDVRMVERLDDGSYRLGLRLFELGELVRAHRSLSETARPIMQDLYEATRQRIHLAVLDGVEVLYVEIIGSAGVDIASRLGGRLPAHATGVGKAMLAYSGQAVVRARVEAGLPALTPRTIVTPGGLVAELRRIRSVGMALDREESTAGLSCVAAPVFGADRTIVGALSISGRTRTFDPGIYGPAVRTAAFTLSRTLRRPNPTTIPVGRGEVSA